jgi:hypothetical protein
LTDVNRLVAAADGQGGRTVAKDNMAECERQGTSRARGNATEEPGEDRTVDLEDPIGESKPTPANEREGGNRTTQERVGEGPGVPPEGEHWCDEDCDGSGHLGGIWGGP